MTPAMTRVTIALALLGLGGASACVDDVDRFAARAERAGATPTTRIARPDDVAPPGADRGLIDEALMVALGQAQNFHAKARVYRADGKLDDAIATVRQVLTLGFPADAPEGEDVAMDARALLGSLLAERGGPGDLDAALALVSAGIDGATRDSFFVANLLTVRGKLHGQRAEAIEAGHAAGDVAAERRAAIVDLDRSISINLAIQTRLAAERAAAVGSGSP